MCDEDNSVASPHDNDDEEEGSSSTLTAIQTAYDNDLYKNGLAELLKPAVGIVLYSLPAVLVLARVQTEIRPGLFSIFSAICIVFGISYYFVEAGLSGEQDQLAQVYEVKELCEEWPVTFPLAGHSLSFNTGEDLTEAELQVMLTEYETISKEARYRDRLINRSTYFALAVLAGFGAIFAQAESNELPVLMMVLSLAMYVFSMAIIKYKDARDPLWKRQRDLERLVPTLRGRLTTYHTIRTPSRRLLDQFSMSSFLINIYLAMTFLAVVSYFGLVVALPLLYP